MNALSRSLVALSLTFAAFGSHAGPLSAIGLDSGIGLLSFGDIEVRNDSIHGMVAVGGNARISGGGIGTGTGSTALVVAGNLDFANGTVKGNALVGGGLTTSWGSNFAGNVAVGGALDARNGFPAPTGMLTVWGESIGVPSWFPPITPGDGEFALGFDFASAQSRLTSLSTQIAGYGSNGSHMMEWSTLVFDAAGLSIAIFDIDAADAVKNMRIDNLAADATVIINIHGETVDFGRHNYEAFTEGQVLFNLADATSVTVGGWVAGSLLAPNATVHANGGKIDGQVIAGSWLGLGHTTIGGQTFVGALPQVSPIANVPEPASLALFFGGLVAAGSAVRRRKG